LEITEADLLDITPEYKALALEKFRKLKTGYLYTPPSKQGTLSMPGTLGGTEWQGASFDPTTNTLFVNSHELPGINRLKEVLQPKEGVVLSAAQRGQLMYQKNCTACHGVGRNGVPPIFPPLKNLGKPIEELRTTIRDGKGLMPSFTQFSGKELDDLAAYVVSDEGFEESLDEAGVESLFLADGYLMFRDDEKTPLIKPPWGTLNAIDLARGEILWRVPLGEYPHLVEKGIRNTGTMNYGGAVATAGGLVFIAATADEKIRAFSKDRGEVLWEHPLPAGGYATPTIYQLDGKQYVVIIAGGGGKNGTPSGDSIVAFALPDSHESLDLVTTDADEAEWIELFDGESLDGWVHMNGSHQYSVEDGVIIGRTYPWSRNSFLCTVKQFDNFELELEVIVDDTTNQGVQFRSRVKPVSTGSHSTQLAGRVWGPQLEVRQFQGMDKPTTGFIYGEAMGTRFLSGDIYPKGHRHYVDQSWNKVRIVAEGPRLLTWVNGTLIDDVTHEEAYETHPHGFIALQVHGMNDGRTYEMGWRNIRIRPLPKR
jgi:quinoprotein glucose dehydrogenase